MVVADAELIVLCSGSVSLFVQCRMASRMCVWERVCVGSWHVQMPFGPCMVVCALVRAQTLLDHLRASWWRDWAAARMG